MRTLLLIVTLVSNFPLLIVGLGIILLLVLVVLFCRNRQKKVGAQSCICGLNCSFNPHSPPPQCVLPTDISSQCKCDFDMMIDVSDVTIRAKGFEFDWVFCFNLTELRQV